MDLMRENSFDEGLFASNIITDTDLDFDLLPDLPCDFLEEESTSNLFLGEDSSNATSDFSDAHYYDITSSCSSNSPQSVISPESPPSTPPTPYGSSIQYPETTTTSFSSITPYCSPPISPHETIKQEADAILFEIPRVKVLPSSILKSARGRSASHDSPDIQALKRHIRMIRNRESASLSRKKKKEYVTNLESRLRDLERENSQLKSENQMLKTRMQQQEKGSFPSLQKNKTKVIAKISVFGLCCLLFINLNPGGNEVVRRHVNITEEFSKTMQDFRPDSLPLTSFKKKSLVWDALVESQENYFGSNDKMNDTLPLPTIAKDMDLTPRRNLTRRSNHHINDHRRDIKNITGMRDRSFLSKSFPHSFTTGSSTSGGVNKCHNSFNKTESLRVQSDLQGIFTKGKRKKIQTPVKPIVYSLIDDNASMNNKGLTLYDEKMSEYSGILKKLHRREDTFYVVALTPENQLLLSAKASNESSRPKMTLLIPWRNDTVGGKEELMQIDCEVFQVFNLNNPQEGRKMKRTRRG